MILELLLYAGLIVMLLSISVQLQKIIRLLTVVAFRTISTSKDAPNAPKD